MASLSLCMIALDEAEWIGELLEQVKPFVDEMILVDTGSKDKTKEIAQSHGAKIIDFTWVDDFSKARNESLKHATSDWILVLDADERVTKEELEFITVLINDTKSDAFFLQQRNYTNNIKTFGWKPNDPKDPMAQGKGFTDNPLIRLFRNHKGFVFSNPVHEVVDESVVANKGEIAKLTVCMHHYGYIKKEEDLQAKKEKYLRISKKQIEADPTNPRPYYEAAKVLKSNEEYEEARGYFEKAAALNPRYQLVLTNLADTYKKLGLLDLAEQTYARAIKEKPRNENAYINLGILLIEQEAKEYILDGTRLSPSYLFLQAIQLNPKSAAAYHNLIALLLKQRKYPQAQVILKKAIEHTGLEKFKELQKKLDTDLIEKHYPQIVEKLLASLKVDPLQLRLVNEVGKYYFMMKKYKESCELFSSTIERYHKEHKNITGEKPPLDIGLLFNIYNNLATAYEKLGQTQQAVEVLEQALSYDPPKREFFEQRIEKLTS